MSSPHLVQARLVLALLGRGQEGGDAGGARGGVAGVGDRRDPFGLTPVVESDVEREECVASFRHDRRSVVGGVSFGRCAWVQRPRRPEVAGFLAIPLVICFIGRGT